MTSRPATADLQLFAAYRRTAWTVSTQKGKRRFQLGAGALSDPDLLPAAIVSAYNPESTMLTTAENAARDRALSDELARREFPVYRALATGSDDTDSSWDEPGFAILGAPFEEVIEIAGRFDQNAIVWIGHDNDARLVITRRGFCGGAPGDFLPL